MDTEWQKACSKKRGRRKRRAKLRCEIAITTEEEGAKIRGVGMTLKIGRTM